MHMWKIKFELNVYICKGTPSRSASVRPATEPMDVSVKKKAVWLSRYAHCQSLRALKKGAFSTARSYRTAVASFLRFREGKDIALDKLSSTLLADYERWLKACGVSMGTLSCYLRSLRSIYNKAVQECRLSDHRPFSRC